MTRSVFNWRRGAGVGIFPNAANSGYVFSSDNTVAHNSAQWDRARNGAGSSTFVTFIQGFSLFGVEAVAAGGLFPFGAYTCVESFFEFDTSDLASIATATLNLRANSAVFQVGETVHVAAYDYGASLTTADWRTSAQLAAFTPAGTLLIADVYSAGQVIPIPIDVAAVNLGGTTRLIVYSDPHLSATPPVDGTNTNINARTATSMLGYTL